MGSYLSRNIPLTSLSELICLTTNFLAPHQTSQIVLTVMVLPLLILLEIGVLSKPYSTLHSPDLTSLMQFSRFVFTCLIKEIHKLQLSKVSFDTFETLLTMAYNSMSPHLVAWLLTPIQTGLVAPLQGASHQGTVCFLVITVFLGPWRYKVWYLGLL